jgi:hypothetical protein
MSARAEIDSLYPSGDNQSSDGFFVYLCRIGGLFLGQQHRDSLMNSTRIHSHHCMTFCQRQNRSCKTSHKRETPRNPL